MKNNLLIVAAIVSSLSVSCEKAIIGDCILTQNGEIPTLYLDSAVESCVVFNENTYWVYKNNLNEYDTVTILSKSSSIIHGSASYDCPDEPHPTPYRETAYVKLYSSYYELEYQDFIDVETMDNGILRTELYRYRANSGSQFKEHNLMLYEYIEDDVENTEGASSTYVEILSEFIMPDTSYTGVYKMNNVKNYFFGSNPGGELLDIYFVRGIGMIKRQDPSNNETWELVSYTIY